MPGVSRYSTGPVLRAIAELDEPAIVPEPVRHVPGARVVLANYDVLQHDFPELQTESLMRGDPSLALLSPAAREEAVRARLDAWLVANAACVSDAQVRHSVVNTPIEAGEALFEGHRPPRYGRGFVTPVRETATASRGGIAAGGLLDLKGAGVAPGKVPSHAQHSDGLEYVGVALADLLFKWVIDEIFRLAAPSFWTVPVYAVLDLGFDIREGWRGTGPAGLHVRRAHRRPPAGMMLPERGSPEALVQFEMEMLLRSYGVTSTNWGSSLEIGGCDGQTFVRSGTARVESLTDDEAALVRILAGREGATRFDRVNLQIARLERDPAIRAQLFDFGHMNVKASFRDPVCSTVRDAPLCIGGILRPDHPAYVQPDPRVCLPFEPWDREALNVVTFELAGQFRLQEISAAELRARLEAPVRALRDRWLQV